MRSLTLLRHARTESDSATGRDFDRQLTDSGRSDAGRVGREIRELGLSFDLVLASPARRVVETVESVGIAARFDERIYNASTGELRGIIQECGNGIGQLMLIGHNPGFEELASMLAGRPIGMSPGALAEIELPIEDWRDLGRDCGRLVRFINPKDFD